MFSAKAPLWLTLPLLGVAFLFWLVFVGPAPAPDSEFGFSQSLVVAGKPLTFTEEITALNPANCASAESSTYQVEILGAWWCIYCRDLRERVLGTEGVLVEYCNEVYFTEVNIDPGDPEKEYDGDERDFYGVTEEGIPQIGLFVNGTAVIRFSGVPDPDALRSGINQLLDR